MMSSCISSVHYSVILILLCILVTDVGQSLHLYVSFGCTRVDTEMHVNWKENEK